MQRGAKERKFEREPQRLGSLLDRVLREQLGAEFLRRFRNVRRLTGSLRSEFRQSEQVRLRRLLAASAVPELVEILSADVVGYKTPIVAVEESGT